MPRPKLILYLLSLTEAHAQSLRNTKHLLTLSELCSFPNICNFYRRFVSGYFRIAASLNHLLKKIQSTSLPPLNEHQAHAFKTLIDAVTYLQLSRFCNLVCHSQSEKTHVITTLELCASRPSLTENGNFFDSGIEPCSLQEKLTSHCKKNASLLFGLFKLCIHTLKVSNSQSIRIRLHKHGF